MASGGRGKYRCSLKTLPHSNPQRITTDNFPRGTSDTMKNNQARQEKTSWVRSSRNTLKVPGFHLKPRGTISDHSKMWEHFSRKENRALQWGTVLNLQGQLADWELSALTLKVAVKLKMCFGWLLCPFSGSLVFTHASITTEAAALLKFPTCPGPLLLPE